MIPTEEQCMEVDSPKYNAERDQKEKDGGV